MLLRPLAVLLLVPLLAAAQTDPVAESRAEYRRAVKAYEARDWKAFLDHARTAQALRPAHGGATYALASAYALNGDTAEAFAALRHYAALGYTAQVMADSDLVSLHGGAAWPDLVRRLAGNAEPLVRSRVAFTLPERDLLAEGIAHDPVDGAFYIGSVHQRKVLRVTADGESSVFATAEQGLWAPLGMRVDPVRRLLWIATAALPQMRDYATADSGRSAVLAFDLDSGAPAGRWAPAPDGAPHALGDLVVTREGRVLASDSRAPVIFRVPERGDTLERFIESALLTSAQGLALTPDEHGLYVADYALGILRVDLRSRGVSLLETADTALVLGIDGLYWHRGGLIGVQNGVAPHRVTRIRLDDRGGRVIRTEVLERAHPAHEEPTLGVTVGDELFYIANAQWERFGDNGTVAPEAPRPTVVLRLRL